MLRCTWPMRMNEGRMRALSKGFTTLESGQSASMALSNDAVEFVSYDR